MAKASGTEWVTGMNSTSHGPMRPLPVLDGDEVGAVAQAGLLDPVPGQADRELGSVDRDLEVAQQVGQSPGVVLVPVGQDDTVDLVGMVTQVGELGQDQVDARHVGVGEHDPAVEDDDAARRPRCRRSCARSPRARPGRRHGRFRLGLCLPRLRQAADRCAGRADRGQDLGGLASSSGVDRPHGQAALAHAAGPWPGRSPWPGSGFGYSSVDSKSKESSSSALPAMAVGQVAGRKASITARNCGPIQWEATLITPRRRRPGAAGS
jgi:hypothetical protein